MSYPNEIKNEIDRHYSLLRNENVRIENERRAQVYENVAGYQELASEQARISAQAARAALAGSTPSAETQAGLAGQLQRLALRKKELLRLNSIPEDYLEPYYHCPMCKDTGFINGKPCSCSKQLLISLLYRYSNLTALDEQNFDKLDMSLYPEHIKSANGGWSVRDVMEQIVDFCKNYAEDFSAEDASSLLITGNTGTSKTFLSSCIARRVMDRGFSVLYLSATDAFTILRQDTWAFKDDEDDETLGNEQVKMLTDCDLMIIDDLGTEPETAHTSSYFFRLINDRLVHKKSTILTSNHTPAQLRRTYTERVVDRITSAPYTHLCTTDGIDFNVRHAVNRP
ncbi:MAG: ATP-binding protein [Lachnospiraceae bacterium]|nr:ATP-binding protein [Lachnospiraceae bacterium]